MKSRQPAQAGKVPNPAVVYRKMRMVPHTTLRREGGAFFHPPQKRKEF